MSEVSNQQLMDRVIDRLKADSTKEHGVTSRELSIATTQLIDAVRHLNVAFSVCVNEQNPASPNGHPKK